MIDVDKTRSVLDQIAHAKDPLGLVRELVLASGGTWIDTATVDMAFLFEVNLHGIRGFGLGASAAIDNWIANAEAIKFESTLRKSFFFLKKQARVMRTCRG